MADDSVASGPGQRGLDESRLRIGAVIAVALAAILVAWVLLRGGHTSPARAHARAMNLSQVRAFARSIGHPVFWVGPHPPGSPSPLTYEVSQTSDRSIYIRYLPAGVVAGSDRKFLTVGTYPNRRAQVLVVQALARPGATRAHGPGRHLAVINQSHPNSVYFAAPRGRFLIEVYDPNAARARRLAPTVRRIG